MIKKGLESLFNGFEFSLKIAKGIISYVYSSRDSKYIYVTTANYSSMRKQLGRAVNNLAPDPEDIHP